MEKAELAIRRIGIVVSAGVAVWFLISALDHGVSRIEPVEWAMAAGASVTPFVISLALVWVLRAFRG